MVGILKNAKPQGLRCQRPEIRKTVDSEEIGGKPHYSQRATKPAPGNPQDSSGAKVNGNGGCPNGNGEQPQRATVTFPSSMALSTSLKKEIEVTNAPIVLLAVKTAPVIVSELTISVP
jgi:hypothetical protein